MVYPNLEAELSRSGITQRQVASLLKKNESTISLWMNGKNAGFPIVYACAIRDEYFPGMSLDYLFSKTPLPTEGVA